MASQKNCILTINGGSSSIKFAVYEMDGALKPTLNGALENIGTKSAVLNFAFVDKNKKSITAEATDQPAAVNFLIDWLQQNHGLASIKAIGHRVVHGMKHTSPEKITAALLKELEKISAYDPEHLPGEIKLIKAFKEKFKAIPQVACFDTSFHTSMPAVARLLAIPRRYYAKGIQRYGFHGLSYAYLLQELKRTGASGGKVILAHLGSGASIAAVKNGKSIDTSMGFTPSAGLPMSTRAGDLDPGVAWYLLQSEKMTPKQFSHLINHESGLLGVSATSNDMRQLLKRQHADHRAAEAVALFCYQAKKYIGAYAAALEGLTTLVFAGGIGEQSPEIRRRICKGLQFLGVEIDAAKNRQNSTIISSKKSKVTVHVIKTNEEIMIAKLVCSTMNYSIKN